MRKSRGGTYPTNWKEIATRIKDEARWTCVRCGVKHDPPNHVLTVHHFDMNPANCAWWNLLPLCARCHLSVQSRVDLDRPYVMADHSAWAKPYLAGYFAWKYLDLTLSREEVEARLEELVGLEREVVLYGGGA